MLPSPRHRRVAQSSASTRPRSFCTETDRVFSDADCVDSIVSKVFDAENPLSSVWLADGVDVLEQRLACRRTIEELCRLAQVNSTFRAAATFALNKMVAFVRVAFEATQKALGEHFQWTVGKGFARNDTRPTWKELWPTSEPWTLHQKLWSLLVTVNRPKQALEPIGVAQMVPATAGQLWMTVSSVCACCGVHCKHLMRNHAAADAPPPTDAARNSPEAVLHNWANLVHPYLGNWLWKNDAFEPTTLQRYVPHTSTPLHFVTLIFTRAQPEDDPESATMHLRVNCENKRRLATVKAHLLMLAMAQKHTHLFQFHLERVFNARIAEIKTHFAKDKVDSFLAERVFVPGAYTFTYNVPLFECPLPGGLASHANLERNVDFSIASMFGLTTQEAVEMIKVGGQCAIDNATEEIREAEEWRKQELERRLLVLFEHLGRLSYYCKRGSLFKKRTGAFHLEDEQNKIIFGTWKYGYTLTTAVSKLTSARKLRGLNPKEDFGDEPMLAHFKRLTCIVGLSFNHPDAHTTETCGTLKQDVLLDLGVEYMKATSRRAPCDANWISTMREPVAPSHPDVFLRFFLNSAVADLNHRTDIPTQRLMQVAVIRAFAMTTPATRPESVDATKVGVQLSLTLAANAMSLQQTSQKRIVFLMELKAFAMLVNDMTEGHYRMNAVMDDTLSGWKERADVAVLKLNAKLKAYPDQRVIFCHNLFVSTWIAGRTTSGSWSTTSAAVQLARRFDDWNGQRAIDWYEPDLTEFCETSKLPLCVCSKRCTFSGRAGKAVFGAERAMEQETLDHFLAN